MLGLVPPYSAAISVGSKALLNIATSSILPLKNSLNPALAPIFTLVLVMIVELKVSIKIVLLKIEPST